MSQQGRRQLEEGKQQWYPGCTKNISKNMCARLKKFIKNNIDTSEVKEDQKVKAFLEKSSFDYNIKDIEALKESRVGEQITKVFFGDLLWCQSLIESKKSDLDTYFTFNHIWY